VIVLIPSFVNFKVEFQTIEPLKEDQLKIKEAGLYDNSRISAELWVDEISANLFLLFSFFLFFFFFDH
jgi:hypothetical protein